MLVFSPGERKKIGVHTCPGGDHDSTHSADVDCAPQKYYPTSGSNFFQPVFMMKPAENIFDSDPASGRQLMALRFRFPY